MIKGIVTINDYKESPDSAPLTQSNVHTEKNVLINKTDPRHIPATSHVIAIAIELARQNGISTQDVLTSAGLTSESLYLPETEFNRFQEISTFESLLDITQSEILGLQIGRSIKVSCLGLPGYAMLVSENVAQAISCLIAFPLLLGWYFNIELEPDERTVTLKISDYCYSDKLKQFSIEMALSSVLTLIEDLLGHAVKPVAVKLTGSSIPHLQKVATFLGCNVEPCEYDGITFELSTFLSLCPLANKVSFEDLYRQCEIKESEWHARTSQDLASKIKYLVSQEPASYSMTNVARELWMTERTLRRRLKEQGISFQKLVNQVRYQKAVTLLETTDTHIADIAEQLGYSDTASFRHAFKRWSRLAPTEFRKLKQREL
ncbi:AraC family transcriptional regulator ligand-binding domain-containing protein [Vibrio sp. YIC-376]|uniref:AraC family transcriptional regulator ligand-binding domain-containing protein n=1 Tax=Vibrio sp. YIC-376 TaxID=3136162 RepID=UPI00402A8859